MQRTYWNYLRNLKESTANKLYELLNTYYGAIEEKYRAGAKQ